MTEPSDERVVLLAEYPASRGPGYIKAGAGAGADSVAAIFSATENPG
jgi:hypothetical protein